ncbi:MAG: hypothetical protein Q9173_002094, partial [Seirophora scorigena]
MWPSGKREQPLDVNQWRQAVANATQPPTLPKPQAELPSPRRLRSTTRLCRSGLRPSSGNRQKLPLSATARLPTGEPTPKRRRHMSASRGPGRPPGRGRGGPGRETDFNQGQGRGSAGGRIEPRPNGEPEQQDDFDALNYVPAAINKVPLKDPDDARSSKATSTQSRSQSGSRTRSRKAYDFDHPISVSQVDLKYLASCTPWVRAARVDQVRRKFTEEACRSTMTLYSKMINIPPNLIPPSLKSAYDQQVDTPCKSRDAPPSHQYASSSEQFYPQALLPQIMKKVDDIRKDADWNEANQADEDQWSLVVHLLLAEVASWPRAQPTKVLKT